MRHKKLTVTVLAVKSRTIDKVYKIFVYIIKSYQ